MTEAERNKRGEKSAVIVERLVRVQASRDGLRSLRPRYRRDAGEMILR